jgi:hypothetical protein
MSYYYYVVNNVSVAVREPLVLDDGHIRESGDDAIRVAQMGISANSDFVPSTELDVDGDIAADNIALSGYIKGVDYAQFDTTYTNGSAVGRLQWNAEVGTLEFGLPGGNVNLQIGQEQLILVRNISGADIPNGSLVYYTGTDSGLSTIDLADATRENWPKALVRGITTELIEDNTNGYLLIAGVIHDVDTDGMTPGVHLYLDTTGNGTFTNTRPTSPDYVMGIGTVTVPDATVGTIQIEFDRLWDLEWASNVQFSPAFETDQFLGWKPENQRYELLRSQRNFFNGTTRESFDATINSTDGTTIQLYLEQSGGGDLTMQFTDGDTQLDCDPTPQTINITPGTNTSPTGTMVYIPFSTKTLDSGTEWPSEEHIKICYMAVPTASFVQTYGGPYVNQNWNDHLSDTAGVVGQGHLSHVAGKIRLGMGAHWSDGVNPDGVDGYFTHGASSITWKSTSGEISQLHDHMFGAKDTSADNIILVANNFDAAYTVVSNLFDIVDDSTGSSIGNNRYFSLIFWGVQNKTDQGSGVVVNLPSGNYTLEASALTDSSNYDDYNFPREFALDSGTAFLICRSTFQKSGTGWNHIQTENLRGKVPSNQVGGGAGGGLTDHGSLGGLADDDHVQYILGDGTRAFTGNVIGVTPVDDADLATKLYVDTEVGGAVITDHGNLDGLGDDDHTQYSLVDGTRAFTGNVIGVDPVDDNDLTTKSYVDTEISGAVIGLPDSANQVYQSTGAGTGAWSTEVTELTLLRVDNLVFDDNNISSNIGIIACPNRLHLGTTPANLIIGLSLISSLFGPGDVAGIAVAGSFESTDSDVRGIFLRPTLKSADTKNAYGIQVSPAIVAATDDTVDMFAGIYVPSAVQTGDGTITTATSLCIDTQTNGVSNYAINVTGGVSRMEDNAKWAFGTGEDSEIFWDTSDLRINSDSSIIMSGPTVVDNITIDGATINSSTDAISFGDDSLTTTGNINGANILPAPTGADQVLLSTGVNASEWVDVADSPWTFKLTADTTIEVATIANGGDDVTGNGSVGAPYATVTRAIEEMDKWSIGDNLVTVNIGAGQYDHGVAIGFYNPYGANVTFQGEADYFTATSFFKSGVTTSGDHKFYTYTLQLPGAEDISAGDYVIVSGVTGGTYGTLGLGCHEVTAWNGTDNRVTIKVIQQVGVPNLQSPSGSQTWSCTLMKTVLTFTSTNGVRTSGPYHSGTWKDVVIAGSGTGSGVRMLSNAAIVFSSTDSTTSGDKVGVANWDANLHTQLGGVIFADFVYVSSAAQEGVLSQSGGIINFPGATVTGSGQCSLRASSSGLIRANAMFNIAGGEPYSVYATQNGFIDAVSSNNYSVEGTLFRAENLASIDASSAILIDIDEPASPTEALSPLNGLANIVGI